VELAGQMDGRKVDGNRVGRITMDGTVTEFPIPSDTGSPINIAVGPDRNIWFTKGRSVWRVTPEGTMTEFPMPESSVSGTGLTAGSDRQAPRRIGNRLWVAASAGNRIAYLSFR
jgi:virginiamycin B lyase